MWRNVSNARKPKNEQAAWVKGGDVFDLVGSNISIAFWHGCEGVLNGGAWLLVIDGDIKTLEPEFWWEGNFDYDDAADMSEMCDGDGAAMDRIRDKSKSYWGDGANKGVVIALVKALGITADDLK